MSREPAHGLKLFHFRSSIFCPHFADPLVDNSAFCPEKLHVTFTPFVTGFDGQFPRTVENN